MSRKLWAVMYLNNDEEWNVCQTLREGHEIACVFFSAVDAKTELSSWPPEPERYKVKKIKVKMKN